MNLQRFPRHPLTFGPTPIQALPRLSAQLGDKVEIYAKREDCNSGLAFGGNKTRKLEYLIPEALEQGCDTLVSIGGIQSNQTRQVAAVDVHHPQVDAADRAGVAQCGELAGIRKLGAALGLQEIHRAVKILEAHILKGAAVEDALMTSTTRPKLGRDKLGRGESVSGKPAKRRKQN